MTDPQRLPSETGSDESLDANNATQTTDHTTELDGDDDQNVNGANRTNSEATSKTPEQLEYERKQAVKASLANNLKAQTAQAQAEATYNTMLNIAMKNPAYLNDLYEIDPETADSITSKLPQYRGMTYLEAVAKEQAKGESKDETEDRITEIVEKRLREKEEAQGQQAVTALEEDMFTELAATHSVRSFEYKRTLEEYKKIKEELGAPKNARQARLYFKEAQDVLRGDEGEPRADMGSLPTLTPRAGRSNDNGPVVPESYIKNALQVNPKLTRKDAIEVYRRNVAGLGHI